MAGGCFQLFSGDSVEAECVAVAAMCLDEQVGGHKMGRRGPNSTRVTLGSGKTGLQPQNRNCTVSLLVSFEC
jgi:hypothetical protein